MTSTTRTCSWRHYRRANILASNSHKLLKFYDLNIHVLQRKQCLLWRLSDRRLFVSCHGNLRKCKTFPLLARDGSSEAIQLKSRFSDHSSKSSAVFKYEQEEREINLLHCPSSHTFSKSATKRRKVRPVRTYSSWVSTWRNYFFLVLVFQRFPTNA